MKSAPVHFYVQRNSYFNTTDTPIPFNLARVNEGNAMDLASGKFTAPRPGIYFFSFTGLANFRPNSSSSSYIYLRFRLNGGEIGSGLIQEAYTDNDQVTFQWTLNLKKGDQVWVEIDIMASGAHLYDSGPHYTHFTGFMLEEEIVTSL